MSAPVVPDAERQVAGLRDALAAVREAIDIPEAATLGDVDVRTPILLNRIMHLSVFLDRVFLDRILGDPMDEISWAIAYLRKRLAECPPAGYQTWDERVAELAAAKDGPRCLRCDEPKPDDGNDWCGPCEDADAGEALLVLRGARTDVEEPSDA